SARWRLPVSRRWKRSLAGRKPICWRCTASDRRRSASFAPRSKRRVYRLRHRMVASRRELMMGTVSADISMSLDGYIAGPNDIPEQGLGEGGERLHEWLYNLE